MDSNKIDFGATEVPQLFVKLFIPTFLGLLFSALFNIADGMFVGRGVGSDALAAINIAAPPYLIATAVGMMLATGVSIVAATLLSQDDVKTANIRITQTFIFGIVFMSIVCILLWTFSRQICFLFGGTEKLLPYVSDYFIFLAPTLIFIAIIMIGQFVMRLDGSPRMSMLCEIIPTLINLFLDWLFVFPLQMGVKGAALATMLAQLFGVVMVAKYLFHDYKKLHLCSIKISVNNLKDTIQNIGRIARLGFSTFIGEIAIAGIMIIGNFLFVKYLREDGVAAFSCACYLLPLTFMVGSSIAQASLPIISYNNGAENIARVKQTIEIAILFAIVSGMILSVLGMFCNRPVLSLFLVKESNAFNIATEGFPYFAPGFLFLTLNIVLIGCLQSLEKSRLSSFFMILRGFVFVIPCFILLPKLLGVKGLWLAIPASELLTFICIAITCLTLFSRKKIGNNRE